MLNICKCMDNDTMTMIPNNAIRYAVRADFFLTGGRYFFLGTAVLGVLSFCNSAYINIYYQLKSLR